MRNYKRKNVLQCAVERSICHSGTIGITCDEDETMINIVNVFFGDLGGFDKDDQCNRSDISQYDCRTQVGADYMNNIREDCDGYQSCDRVETRQSQGTYCNPEWPNEYSEYVTVVYRCVEILGRCMFMSSVVNTTVCAN